MKTKILLLLFSTFILIFYCCQNSTKKSHTLIKIISSDFPVAEELKFASFNKYEIFEESGGCVIDDSILWHFENGQNDFGYCYDLNTGERLSVIALKGDSSNQLKGLNGFDATGDSLHLYESQNTIKSFAKKDIINNTPSEDRQCSITTISNNILVSRIAKLPNGSTIATLRPAIFEFEKKFNNKINEGSIVLLQGNQAKVYETINYDSFNVEKAKSNEFPANDLIKWAYAQGSIAVKDNNTVAFSVNDQFILYTLDLNTGEVTNEKRYSTIRRDGGEMTFSTTNDNYLNVLYMKANEKYILCEVNGYFSEENKNSGEIEKAIFVFDWNLNPIKMFKLPIQTEGYYRISNGCDAVYFCKQHSRNGITLYKANLNINTENQELHETN